MAHSRGLKLWTNRPTIHPRKRQPRRQLRCHRQTQVKSTINTSSNDEDNVTTHIEKTQTDVYRQRRLLGADPRSSWTHMSAGGKRLASGGRYNYTIQLPFSSTRFSGSADSKAWLWLMILFYDFAMTSLAFYTLVPLLTLSYHEQEQSSARQHSVNFSVSGLITCNSVRESLKTIDFYNCNF